MNSNWKPPASRITGRFTKMQPEIDGRPKCRYSVRRDLEWGLIEN